MDIIKEQFNITFDKENLDTTRLMTHLKFLANRVIYHENENIVELDDMYDLLISKKSECKSCIEKIDDNRLYRIVPDVPCEIKKGDILLIHKVKILLR